MTSPGRPTAEFFFDCACPWTCLAFVRLREAATRTAAGIAYRPIVARWIEGGHSGPLGGTAAGAHPNATAYAQKDLRDWARFCGVRLREPVRALASAELAQRGAVVAIGCGRGAEYLAAIFHAAFTDGRDIAAREVVLEAAAAGGLAPQDFAARLDAAETLEMLRANTAELVRRGGFGSPTLFVGEDMYVGHDRMPLVEAALMHSAERPFIAPGEHGR